MCTAKILCWLAKVVGHEAGDVDVPHLNLAENAFACFELRLRFTNVLFDLRLINGPISCRVQTEESPSDLPGWKPAESGAISG